MTLIAFAPLGPAFAACDNLKAEADDLLKTRPNACDEAKTTHDAFVKGLPAAIDLCRSLENRASAGAPKLTLGSESEMVSEAMEIKQRHLAERQEVVDRVSKELFPTPLDKNDPGRPPTAVSPECAEEIELHVHYRNNLLRALGALFERISDNDDALFTQAGERALPGKTEAPAKNVR